MLWVIMPARNEELNVASVVLEWIALLRQQVGAFVLLVIDDGSTDSTGAILEGLAGSWPELRVVHRENAGHGQSCVHGYRLALQGGASWVFQIDSDGQCDPAYFQRVWKVREAHPVVFGFRSERRDGFRRDFITRLTAVTASVVSRTRLRDPNVPFRLIRADHLARVLPHIPDHFHLANIAVAIWLQRLVGIHWEDIGFRPRRAGAPSVVGLSYARRALQLVRQLREMP